MLNYLTYLLLSLIDVAGQQCDPLCHQLFFVKKGRCKWFLFYVNTPQNKKPAAYGALFLSLLTPSCLWVTILRLWFRRL